MKTAIPWKMKTNQAGVCDCLSSIFQARVVGERHHLHEIILRYVQKALDDTSWGIDRDGFDELVTSQKQESAPFPDGIPYGFCRSAGGLGSQFVWKAYKHVIEGCLVLPQYAASRTVFSFQSPPMSTTMAVCEIAGRITSVDTLQLSLQDPHHGNLPRPSMAHYEMYTSISDVFLQGESTALAHVACAPG